MYRTVDGRWGKCTYLSKDIYVGGSMHNYGEFSPDETEKILSLAAGRCLDVGANIGCISQALLAKGFNVAAFEPQPEIFKLLTINCPTAENLNAACGASEGTATMPKLHYSEKNNFGGVSLGMVGMFGSYNVPVITIDSLGYDDVGFIKIDVESYELEVLQGAHSTIKRCKPILYIEDDRMEKRSVLRDYITELGYKYELTQPSLFRENNFFNNKKDIWAPKRVASLNLICTPI